MIPDTGSRLTRDAGKAACQIPDKQIIRHSISGIRYQWKSYSGEEDLEHGDPLRVAKGLLMGILLLISFSKFSLSLLNYIPYIFLLFI
jgi:hypothetical protein